MVALIFQTNKTRAGSTCRNLAPISHFIDLIPLYVVQHPVSRRVRGLSPRQKKVVLPRAPHRRVRTLVGGRATVEWLLGGSLRLIFTPAVVIMRWPKACLLYPDPDVHDDDRSSTMVVSALSSYDDDDP
jgi:hypothetical protein